MSIWFIPIMVLYILLNWLIGRQLFDLLRINLITFGVPFIILAFSPLLSRLGPFSVLDKVGNYWMVFFYYATLVAVLGFVIKNKPFIIGCYLLIIVVIIIGSVQAKNVQLVKYDIIVPKNAGSLHAVLLSDIHLNRTKGSGFVKKMVDDINKLHPDMCF